MTSKNNLVVEKLSEKEITEVDDFISFKIIIVGDSGVGKSSILKRALQNIFESSYQATIGFEFILMCYKINDKYLKLQIWDTCGQEMYRSLIQGFYRNTSLALLVYEIDNKKSFDNIDKWFSDVKQYGENSQSIYLIGNKADKSEREVLFDEAKQYADDNKLNDFFEVSAKNGLNIESVFCEAAKDMYIKYLEYEAKNGKPNQKGKRLAVDDSEKDIDKIKTKKKCCKL